MFSSKQKTIKSMFSAESVKKVEKSISKFFIFNEGICCSEENGGVREAGDDDGEDTRILSSSSNDECEDGDDDGSDDDDNNNGGNNGTDGRTYSLEGQIQGLDLTSGQHYGVKYDYDNRSQLERSANTSIGFSAYRKDDYDDDVMPHRNSM